VDPSGAGKSSVVRAGLLPALRQQPHPPLSDASNRCTKSYLAGAGATFA
jgi:hypothetical protein